ncbi:hypothetical protein CGCSCA5_v000053 [Colletotrichum siamense]|nr:hypothetical protein CGCSCA5_v000053 [Colletotrichum siamense]
MVRRLPWTHPHRKVDYTGNNTSSEMVFTRTPRGGRRGGLTYNNSSYGKSNYSNNRYSRGGYGNGGGGPNTPSSQKKRLDGLYLEGNWYCNCEPRMQAKYLQTKKQGKNHGRYFWTCESRGCNFFLWDDDAKNRAEGNTLTLPPMPEDEPTKNGAAMSAPAPVPAPAATLPTPTTATPRQRSMGDYLTQQKEAETPSRTAKRKRVLFEFSDDDEEDDFGLGDMSSDEERQMNEAMERSAKKLRDTAPVTPSSRRMAESEVDTPGTVSRTLFPDAKRRNTGTGSFSAASTASSMTANPSMSPPASQTQEEQLDPTDEVMALLRGQKVDEATMGEVRGVLRRYAMKAKGIARGRDSVRTALKTKDEKIAGLQERVASLEDRNRAQREEIADFKASIMDLYSKH